MQHLSDDGLQDYFLQGVSRTFALTIPVLPEPLRRVVANAYLQCRIIDTIEDDPGLSLEQKQVFAQHFIDVLAGTGNVETFATDLAPLLSESLLEQERELVRATPDIVRIYQTFPEEDRVAILNCVQSMGKGMVLFQQRQTPQGLSNLQEMEDYCYYVAGVVGEMLTVLYGNQAHAIREHQSVLMPLARSFGQGLQMTNILKDVWEDLERGVCWLPTEEFRSRGYSLDNLVSGETDAAFVQGLNQLIALAHYRLGEALQYTLRIPAREKNIRLFNLWSLGMAMLTLRNIYKQPGYRSGKEVKISRNRVRMMSVLMKLIAGNNRMLKIWFYLVGRGLPHLNNAPAPVVPDKD